MAPVEPQRPRAPQPSNVDQLVQALAALNPKINRAVGQYFEEENKQAAADAELQVLKDNVGSWAEAVAKDPTLADRSPVFRRVYEERAARNAVQARGGQLMAEYFSSEIAASEDPTAINGWLKERFKDTLEAAKTPAERAAVAEEMAAVSRQFIVAHRERARGNLVDKNRASVSTGFQNTFDNYAARGPAVPYKTDDPAAVDLLRQSGDPHAARKAAFLNATAGGESGGKYNIRYDGGSGSFFELNGQHPQVKVMTDKGPSDAAGRYQFLSSTWRRVMGDAPFTPANQDLGAIKLAEQDYAARTGGKSLWDDMAKEGFSPRIQSVLGPTWIALKGNQGRHLATYNAGLQKYGGTPTGPGVQNGHVPEIVSDIHRQEDLARKQGMSPSDINKLSVEAVTNAAIRQQDETILDVASQPRPDGTPGAGLTVEGRQAIDTARKQIRALKIQEQNQAHVLESRRREVRTREMKKLAMDALFNQMKAGEPPRIGRDTLETANREDPDMAKELMDVQKNLDDFNKTEDPILVGRFQQEVYTGRATPADVFDKVRDGTLRATGTINQLMEQANRNIGRSIITRPEVKPFIDDIEKIIGEQQMPGVFKKPVEAALAARAFTSALLEFEKQKPDATPTERHEFADKQFRNLMAAYKPDVNLDSASPEGVVKRREEDTALQKKLDGGEVLPVRDNVDWKKARFFNSPAEVDEFQKKFAAGQNVDNPFTKAVAAFKLDKKSVAEFVKIQKQLASKKQETPK
jgi:muramidase (phage lysozyme)